MQYMTEAPKGLMTSKELGMAVAEKLQQAEERREGRDTEQPRKQQLLMRRALMPPQRNLMGLRQQDQKWRYLYS